MNIPELYIKIYDIIYEFKLKNKSENRENRLYFFGLKKNMDLISYANIIEFFVDVTFKIIPVEFLPNNYSLLMELLKQKKNLNHLIWYLQNIQILCLIHIYSIIYFKIMVLNQK